MEHEVYVPFPVGTVRQALTEPERLARCVPGAQLDADPAPGVPEGRLRLRVGGSTITYRGSLRVTPRDGEPDAFDAAARGTEVRGDGFAELDLTVRLAPDEGGKGTTLSCTADVRSGGRLAAATDDAVRTAGRRLLERFATTLTEDLSLRPVAAAEPDGTDGPAAAEAGAGPAADGADPLLDEGALVDEGALTAEDAEDTDDIEDGLAADGGREPGAEDDPAEVTGVDGPDADDDEEADGLVDAPTRSGVFETEIPPSSLDPLADEELGMPAEPPAEAAHARRTMIGRSAEEVDHAPPRGRYAPVPAPDASTASATLRWAAPAAAVVLASAVVVGRALRRRR
ncbi:carbon monoxide dehydrogenase subunit G [Streptomyces sp. Ru73]|uniref:CoxG family protein n=1 Tax=Streptomyces sp. Ru73 TaxID=2080748 RepID=UPI000CDDCBDE|nr:SRPBCC domain-containing protein [Streptomyces sp. Ru73]POX42075.1 carbon monoxide dehydrogenase subunit G [Streptomyces sp. Ru73]